MANRSGGKWKQWQILFSWAPKSLKMVTAAMKYKRRLLLGRKAMTNLDRVLKSRYHFTNKGSYSQRYGFSSSHVWMWELDYKGGWALKNWCFQIVVIVKTLESPVDCKEIKAIDPEYSLEGLLLKLKLQSFGHLMRRADSWKRSWC